MSDNEEIKEAKELYDKIQSSEREQELAELRLKYIRDNNAIQKYGYEHGYERGREDGKIAGMEIEEVQKITELSVQEIKEIKK